MKKIVALLFLLNLVANADTIRIMPMGDSITFGDSYNPPPDPLKQSYRSYLWYKLTKDYDGIDFVGSQRSGWDVVPEFDPDNEGYPGWSSFEVADIAYARLVQNQPDIILLHIGSNDMWKVSKSGEDLSGVDRLLDEVDSYERNYDHHITVIVAQIIDRVYHPSFTSSFNRNLRHLVSVRKRRGDDLILVDMQHGAGLNYDTDFQDPTHPSSAGYKKMAEVWYRALLPLVKKNKKQDFSWLIAIQNLMLQ